MALIRCTECGKDFSDKAPACPNCGCPTKDATPLTYTVTLQKGTSEKINLIKAIRQTARLGIKESKDIVDNAPKVVSSGLSLGEAQKIQQAIESFGGVAKIERTDKKDHNNHLFDNVAPVENVHLTQNGMIMPESKPSKDIKPKTKKPWYRRWWGMALILFVCLTFFAIFSGDKKQEKARENPTPAQNESKEKKQSKDELIGKIKNDINENFRLYVASDIPSSTVYDRATKVTTKECTMTLTFQQFKKTPQYEKIARLAAGTIISAYKSNGIDPYEDYVPIAVHIYVGRDYIGRARCSSALGTIEWKR